MNLVSERLRPRFSQDQEKVIGDAESLLSNDDLNHIDDFDFDPNYLDVRTNVPGLGVVGLTPGGAIRVNSEQLLVISKMPGLGNYETKSQDNGTFLIIPKKNHENSDS